MKTKRIINFTFWLLIAIAAIVAVCMLSPETGTSTKMVHCLFYTASFAVLCGCADDTIKDMNK